MSELKIHTYGDPVLSKKAEPVTVFDAELKRVCSEMVSAMFEHEGVGLAAPQVGISKRFIVIGMPIDDDPDKRQIFIMINPEIIGHGEEMDSREEGCLSVPDITEEVERYLEIEVRWQNLDGTTEEIKAEGYFARVIQHEMDHLDGILFVERLSVLKRSLLKGKLKRLKDQQKEMNIKA